MIERSCGSYLRLRGSNQLIYVLVKSKTEYCINKVGTIMQSWQYCSKSKKDLVDDVRLDRAEVIAAAAVDAASGEEAVQPCTTVNTQFA